MNFIDPGFPISDSRKEVKGKRKKIGLAIGRDKTIAQQMEPQAGDGRPPKWTNWIFSEE
jgi:hypothetical protein